MSAGERGGYYGRIQAFRMDIAKCRLMKKIFFVGLFFYAIKAIRFRNITYNFSMAHVVLF